MATGALMAAAAVSPASAGEVGKDCKLNGIALQGKVEVVDSFPDPKVQLVGSFPDFTVQFVEIFPDLTVTLVESFPGVP